MATQTLIRLIGLAVLLGLIRLAVLLGLMIRA
jgi:nitrogen fixation-related uncharacterized protein